MSAPLSRPCTQVLLTMLEDAQAEYYALPLAEQSRVRLSGTYAALDRLERLGLVFTGLEDLGPVLETRRPRRWYKLTEDGQGTARSLPRPLAAAPLVPRFSFLSGPPAAGRLFQPPTRCTASRH